MAAIAASAKSRMPSAGRMSPGATNRVMEYAGAAISKLNRARKLSDPQRDHMSPHKLRQVTISRWWLQHYRNGCRGLLALPKNACAREGATRSEIRVAALQDNLSGAEMPWIARRPDATIRLLAEIRQ
jgi:hypothetical protein